MPRSEPPSERTSAPRSGANASPERHGRFFVAGIAGVAAFALAGTIAGFPRLDHCPTVACDFAGFHAQGRVLLRGSFAILPDWRLPPFAALVFAPLGALRLRYAVAIWEAAS